MNNDEFWTSVYSGKDDSTRPTRLSVVRLALLFGLVAGAMAVIVPPLLHPYDRNRSVPAGTGAIDYLTTSSIDRKQPYSVRRSVLTDSPDAVCIIDIYGNRSGDC